MYCSLGVRIFSVALSLFALNYGVTAIPKDDFYEFRGLLPGQESLGRNDDNFSSPISLTPGFNFFGNIFNTIYVSTSCPSSYINVYILLLGEQQWLFLHWKNGKLYTRKTAYREFSSNGHLLADVDTR